MLVHQKVVMNGHHLAGSGLHHHYHGPHLNASLTSMSELANTPTQPASAASQPQQAQLQEQPCSNSSEVQDSNEPIAEAASPESQDGNSNSGTTNNNSSGNSNGNGKNSKKEEEKPSMYPPDWWWAERQVSFLIVCLNRSCYSESTSLFRKTLNNTSCLQALF